MTAGSPIDALAGALTVESLVAAGSIKWTSHGPGTLAAWVAEMDFGTAPVVTAALHDAVRAERFGYLSPQTVRAVQEAGAAWQRDAHGWSVAPESVVVLPDVLVGLQLTIRHLCRPGSPIILPTPAYMPFLTVPPYEGRTTIQVPVRRDGYDLDALDRAFRAGGQLLVLCNPHNPLGSVLDRSELAAIAEVVARHDGRVFADEIHAPLTYAGRTHVPYASLSAVTARHTVTATSASKAWNLAGLTCAQLILTSAADRAVVAALDPFATNGASTLGAIATTVALTAGRPWLDDVVAYLDGTRRLLTDLLAEHLPDVRWTPPEATYLAWLDCRALGLPGSPSDFFAAAAGVVTVDGARCGPPGEGFVRLNFATSRALVEEMVTRMAAAVARR